MNNFLGLGKDALNFLDNCIHENIKDTFADDLIHELKDYLQKQESDILLENLSLNTKLHFAKYEGEFAICFDYKNKDIYKIPKEYIKDNNIESGDAIKFSINDKKKFYIDESGIQISKDKVYEYLNECKDKRINSNLSNKIPQYYIVNEISKDVAICKNKFTLEIEKVPIDDIPKNVNIGDCLICKNGKFMVN